MVEPAETLRRPEEEKTPEEKRKEFKVIKGGGKKRWGPGAKAGAIVGSTAAVVSGVAAALGETDNLPDPLQGFYDQAFHPSKVAEEKSDQALRGKYDVKEANEDFAKIVNETNKTKTEVQTEITPNNSALEAILQEKVSFISEALPGAELNTKTGELTAKVGNEWGIPEGGIIGCYVVKGLKVETADGVEAEEDVIGLIPPVIEAMQNEIFEKTKERLLPIFIDLTTAEDVKMQKLEAAGAEIDKKVWAFNVSVGTEFLTPLSGGWGMFKPFPNVEDKCFFTDWDIGKEENLGGIDIYFKEAKILAEMKEGPSIPNLKTGTRQTLMNTHVELGDSLGMISNQTSLEEFSRSGWGEYQLVTFLKNNDKIMEVGSGTNTYKVFIFNQ